jgi:hypothetical protein
MPKLQKERLRLLAKRLREHKDNGRRFNMDTWFDLTGSGHNEDDDRIDIKKRVVDPYTGRVKEERTCGTSACALGEACTIPAFRRLGLKLVPGAGFDADLSYTPMYKRRKGLAAGMAFFGLTEYQASYLFLPDHYPGLSDDIEPMDVVERIEDVCSSANDWMKKASAEGW